MSGPPRITHNPTASWNGSIKSSKGNGELCRTMPTQDKMEAIK